ncbi:MAG: hypothetical protein ACR2NN_21320 [Bryobacteraceae bacterium]
MRLRTQAWGTATMYGSKGPGSGILWDRCPRLLACRIQIYDKFGQVLRIETTINDYVFFHTTAR